MLIVAEAPGKDEDQRGKQLIGDAGQLLRKTLNEFGVDLDRDCWKTNTLICRPPNNRTPTDQEIEYCAPNLTAAIKEYNPDVIIPLGGPAVAATLGRYWHSDLGGIGRWAGFTVPLQPLNAWVCPTWHPSYLQRAKRPELGVWWARHLRAAFALKDKPWKEVPDYKKEVTVIMDPEEAARQVALLCAFGNPIAVDYETNMLKPDS